MFSALAHQLQLLDGLPDSQKQSPMEICRQLVSYLRMHRQVYSEFFNENYSVGDRLLNGSSYPESLDDYMYVTRMEKSGFMG